MLIGADFLCGAGWILEVSTDRLLDLLAAVEQPEHDEQCHHCGYEVGISHFPRATMMASVTGLLLNDDDGTVAGHESSSSQDVAAASAAGADSAAGLAAVSRQAFSTS